MSGSAETATEESTPNAAVETKARDIHTYFGEGFGTVSFDRYRNLDGENEFEFIRTKILYAFFGPPVFHGAIFVVGTSLANSSLLINSSNTTTISSISNISTSFSTQRHNYFEEYTSKQNDFVTPIYDKICACKKYSPSGNNVCMSILYVCVVPHDKSKTLEEHADILSSNIIIVPLFKVRKCIRTDLNDARPSCSVYIDEYCRVYSDWKSYLKNNKLPKGVIVVPKDGKYQFSNDEPSMVLLETCFSPQSSKSAAVTEKLDKACLITGLASTAVFAASFVIPVVGPIITGAALASTSGGVYGLYTSGKTLADRYAHEQSINLSDSQARGCWISVVGSVGLITVGATKILSMAARNGMVVNQGFQRLTNVAIFASIGSNFVASGVFNIIYNYAQDGATPSTLELIQLTSSIFFFCHSTMNLKTASIIIEETQISFINQERIGLRSNRHRKVFDKLTAETRRQAGGSQQGNAEVIRSMKNINNKDDFFASALHMNKEFNANKVKVSFGTDGSMKLTAGQKINPTDFVNLNPSERAEFLSNVNKLNLSAKNYSTVPTSVEFSSDFSYQSANLLVRFMQSPTDFQKFIANHIADLINDNLNRVSMIAHRIIDELPPMLRELLESNSHDMFEVAFKFAYDKIRLLVNNIKTYKNFTDALSFYFVAGNIDSDTILSLVSLFPSYVCNLFESSVGSNTCNICGGHNYES